jgi:hypothetical protein
VGAGFGPSPRQVCTLVPVPLLPRPHTPLATEYPTLVGSMGTGYGQTHNPTSQPFLQGRPSPLSFPAACAAPHPAMAALGADPSGQLVEAVHPFSEARAAYTAHAEEASVCDEKRGCFFLLASRRPLSPSPLHAPPFAASDPWAILVCEDVPCICCVCDSVRS